MHMTTPSPSPRVQLLSDIEREKIASCRWQVTVEQLLAEIETRASQDDLRALQSALRVARHRKAEADQRLQAYVEMFSRMRAQVFSEEERTITSRRYTPGQSLA